MVSIRRITGLVALLLLSAAPASAQLVISEFRLRGPGPGDATNEFVEIMNNSATSHTVAGGGAGYALAASDGVARCVIPNGTILPPGGRYLCVNSAGYSLASYPAGNGTTATGDATYTTDIPDNAGIALFNTSVPADFTLANRFDAVGSTSEANTLYKEGTGYPALIPSSIDHAFYRDQCGKGGSITTFGPCPSGGAVVDTNNNAADFVFVDTNGTSAGAGQRLGAPGPQNLSSPLSGAASMPADLLDPCVAVLSPPNRVRDFTSDPVNNSTFGTLDLRATYTNNTGGNVTRLRFRVVDLTTFPAPSGIADLRPRTSSDVVVTVDRPPCGSGTSNITVQGTTLEQPPSQPNGGGFNSSLSLGDVTLATPLADGATVDVRFLLGIQQTGMFKIGLVLETLPDGVATLHEFAGCTDASACPDLAITKTDGVTTATPGGSVTYTITASNAGPNTSIGATVADTFPAALACTWTCVGAGGGTCTAAGAGNINDTVNMPAGGSVTYTASCTIAAGATGTLVNTATVTPPAGFEDPNTGNNSATDTDTLIAQSDLAITKTDGVTTVTPGGSTTYTITASNAGPSDAPGATLADTFPASLTCTWTCVGAGGGTCTAAGSGNISDTVNLPAGGSVTYTASCTIASGASGTLSNTATVAPPAGVTDPTPGNNSATDTDTLIPQADLAITKTDGVTTVTPGGSTTYTITASNAGPSNASSATVADTFPASLTCTWTCVGAGGGTCTAAGSGNINDTVNLPAGGSVTYTASCAISPSASGTLSNTATVAAPAGVTDPNPANNSATDTDTVSAQADLAITKTDGVSTATPGGSTTYTITASNAGPSNASSATVADTFPASLTCTWTCVGAGGGTCTAAGSGNISNTVNLPAGGSVTYTASCTIAPGATGTLSNTATVAAPAGVTDPNPANNSATDTDTLTAQADLAITKTDGVTEATPGGSVTYTIVASNAGPSNATGATVADTFPASLTCTWTCVGAGGGTCTAAGSGNINNTVNLPAGASVTYTASCAISLTASGTLSNTATVAAPAGVADPNSANNSATDTDTLIPRGGCDVNGDGLDEIVTGAGPGGGPHVRVLSLGTGAELASFFAYASSFVGGVSVACGDVNGDGLADIITGAGPGGGPHVRAFSMAGGSPTELASFFAYAPTFVGGVFVAVGDVSGDGLADVVTGAGAGGGPHVRAFSLAGGGVTEVASFFAYDPAFVGGVFVAVGDVSGDGVADIVTGAGAGGGPHVRAFSMAGGSPSAVASFFAYTPAFTGGVRVAVGDVTGDGVADIITGPGVGGGPHVRAFSLAGGGPSEVASFFAYDPAFVGGVFVAVGDVTGDGVADFITGAGAGGGPHIRVFDGVTGAEVESFFAYDPAFVGGVFVGGAPKG